jgi:hypothetical protein
MGTCTCVLMCMCMPWVYAPCMYGYASCVCCMGKICTCVADVHVHVMGYARHACMGMSHGHVRHACMVCLMCMCAMHAWVCRMGMCAMHAWVCGAMGMCAMHGHRSPSWVMGMHRRHVCMACVMGTGVWHDAYECMRHGMRHGYACPLCMGTGMWHDAYACKHAYMLRGMHARYAWVRACGMMRTHVSTHTFSVVCMPAMHGYVHVA